MDISPSLQALIESLQRDIAEARAEISALRAENASLKQEVADLKRRLGKDSSNSSQPPSSDGLGKKPRVAGSLRGVSGKPSGGQRGHKGGTLRLAAEPDHTECHEASRCMHCQAELSAAMATGGEVRQVFDMPQPRLEVTEHRAQIYTCTCCGGVTKAAFPEGVTSHVQYGTRIRAAAVYLNAQQLIPEDRVGDIMTDLFGAELLCPASIAAWSAKKACDLKSVVADIAALVAQAPVRNLDETGFRIAGLTQWLHTASTPTLTCYRISKKRGAMMTGLRGGIIVHDHFRPYYLIEGVGHALCNAHLLRELKALIDIEKELWARNMSHLLTTANKAVQQAVERGANVLAEPILRSLVTAYDALVAEGIAFHEQQPPLPRPLGRGKQAKRPGHNLALRLRNFKTEALRFLCDFRVPFTNNLAEQDIRMMKVKMKVSGSFRTVDGAETFATIRSVISTARKQGWSMIQTLTAPAETLRANLKA